MGEGGADERVLGIEAAHFDEVDVGLAAAVGFLAPFLAEKSGGLLGEFVDLGLEGSGGVLVLGGGLLDVEGGEFLGGSGGDMVPMHDLGELAGSGLVEEDAGGDVGGLELVAGGIVRDAGGLAELGDGGLVGAGPGIGKLGFLADHAEGLVEGAEEGGLVLGKGGLVGEALESLGLEAFTPAFLELAAFVIRGVKEVVGGGRAGSCWRRGGFSAEEAAGSGGRRWRWCRGGWSRGRCGRWGSRGSGGRRRGGGCFGGHVVGVVLGKGSEAFRHGEAAAFVARGGFFRVVAVPPGDDGRGLVAGGGVFGRAGGDD